MDINPTDRVETEMEKKQGRIFEVEGKMHREQRSGGAKKIQVKMPESAFFCRMRLEQKREMTIKQKSGYSS